MSVQALLSLGADEHPEVFKQAETACKHYAQSVSAMTEKEKFDFRRGFELGCYFAIYNMEFNNTSQNFPIDNNNKKENQ